MSSIGEGIMSRHSERLFTGNTYGVTRVSMPGGDSLPEHVSAIRALLLVISGKIAYCDAGGQRELQAGESQVIEAYHPHGLIARNDSVFILVR